MQVDGSGFGLAKSVYAVYCGEGTRKSVVQVMVDFKLHRGISFEQGVSCFLFSRFQKPNTSMEVSDEKVSNYLITFQPVVCRYCQ